MKIAVVGSAAHCVKAPFGDPSWEIWGCNAAGLPRWDRWFELHDIEKVLADSAHWEWIQAQINPVYMQTNHDTALSSVTYPLEAMIRKYGTWFFTSSISFMLALAIEEKPEEIAVYGVDLAADEEYAHQKPGCRFFIQTASLAGIKVTGPAEAEVFAPGKLYGFGKPHPLAYKVATRTAELKQRQADLQARKEQLTLTIASLKGALDIKLPKEQIPAVIADVQKQLSQADRDILMFEGALQNMSHVEKNWLGD